jgi:hypothetical protein
MCSGSGSSKEGGTTVEDQNKGQNLGKDEDVEAHMNKAVNKGAVNKGRNLNKDDEDVEAHMNKAVNKGRNLNKDDDEDVEAHMNLNMQKGMNKGMNKA